MPEPVLKVEAETPESAQGEIDESPRPAPKARRAKLNAAATTAPAAMLAQETADQPSATRLSVCVIVSTAASKSFYLQGNFRSSERFQLARNIHSGDASPTRA